MTINIENNLLFYNSTPINLVSLKLYHFTLCKWKSHFNASKNHKFINLSWRRHFVKIKHNPVQNLSTYLFRRTRKYIYSCRLDNFTTVSDKMHNSRETHQIVPISCLKVANSSIVQHRIKDRTCFRKLKNLSKLKLYVKLTVFCYENEFFSVVKHVVINFNSVEHDWLFITINTIFVLTWRCDNWLSASKE